MAQAAHLKIRRRSLDIIPDPCCPLASRRQGKPATEIRCWADAGQKVEWNWERMWKKKTQLRVLREDGLGDTQVQG
jgi:hypothetical protein